MEILVLAGDLTNYYLYHTLKDNGYDVTLEGFDHLEKKIPKKGITLSGYKTIICSIPFTIDNSTIYSPYSYDNIHIDHLLEFSDSNTQIIGGPFNFNDERFYDLTKNRTFTDLTVIPTCEELVKIIITESDVTIKDSNITVFGKGRVSTHLIKVLEVLGANVNVNNSKSDIIVNTTSTKYIDKEFLTSCSNKVLIIDVAAKDGGVDYNYVKKSSMHLIKARGLPSKSAPKSVSNYIYQTLINEALV